jgi:hypothetical protein
MTSALEGGEWSASRPGRTLPPGKTRYPLYRRLGGPQGRSGQVRKISPPPGYDPRTVQPVVSHYTDWATGCINCLDKCVWKVMNLFNFQSMECFWTQIISINVTKFITLHRITPLSVVVCTCEWSICAASFLSQFRVQASGGCCSAHNVVDSYFNLLTILNELFFHFPLVGCHSLLDSVPRP